MYGSLPGLPAARLLYSFSASRSHCCLFILTRQHPQPASTHNLYRHAVSARPDRSSSLKNPPPAPFDPAGCSLECSESIGDLEEGFASAGLASASPSPVPCSDPAGSDIRLSGLPTAATAAPLHAAPSAAAAGPFLYAPVLDGLDPVAAAALAEASARKAREKHRHSFGISGDRACGARGRHALACFPGGAPYTSFFPLAAAHVLACCWCASV